MENPQVGMRVYYEPENNGPLWRGVIEEVQDDEFVWVRWDGDVGQKLVTTADLQTDH